jgi:hypothetical protein
MVALGDINVIVGNVEMEGMIGKFGVPGVNWTGECMVEFLAKSGLIVGTLGLRRS